MSERKIQLRKYTIVDKETGEVVADDAMFIGRKAFIDKGFRKIFVGFLRDIVMDKEIAGKSIRLLLWIIENLRNNDLEVYMYWQDICEELNITQGTYYSWLKTLLDRKIIEKTKKPNIYRLLPFSAVNGQMGKAIERTYNE